MLVINLSLIFQYVMLNVDNPDLNILEITINLRNGIATNRGSGPRWRRWRVCRRTGCKH